LDYPYNNPHRAASAISEQFSLREVALINVDDLPTPCTSLE